MDCEREKVVSSMATGVNMRAIFEMIMYASRLNLCLLYLVDARHWDLHVF